MDCKRAEAEILSEAAPVVVWRLIDAIEKHGLSSESLYRAPPASGGPAELRQALDSAPFWLSFLLHFKQTITPAGRKVPGRITLKRLSGAEISETKKVVKV
ncbi:hypothetical protein PAMP_024010 [Pampus punctatissimus]